MTDKAESAFDYYLEKPSNTLLPQQANFELDKGFEADVQGGIVSAESAGAVRHARERVGVVPRQGSVRAKDPKGLSHAMSRGGGWIHDSWNCRAGDRREGDPFSRYWYIGFRLARVPVGKEIVKIIAP